MERKRKRSQGYYLGNVVSQVWRHPGNAGRRIRALIAAAAWQLYKRAWRRPLTRRFYRDLRIRCYPDSSVASRLIYFGTFHAYDELHLLARLLRPGDTFVDGGANIGTHTLLAASLVGDHGHVLAFEPDPTAARRLRENVALNALTNVAVHEAALSDSHGGSWFTAGWDVANSLLSERGAEHDARQVRTLKLEGCLQHPLGFGVAKLDLEGAEVAALRGAAALLGEDGLAVLQLECHEHQLRRLGASADALRRLLSDHSYGIFEYRADQQSLERLSGTARLPETFLGIQRGWQETVRRRLGLGPCPT